MECDYFFIISYPLVVVESLPYSHELRSISADYHHVLRIFRFHLSFPIENTSEDCKTAFQHILDYSNYITVVGGVIIHPSLHLFPFSIALELMSYTLKLAVLIFLRRLQLLSPHLLKYLNLHLYNLVEQTQYMHLKHR